MSTSNKNLSKYTITPPPLYKLVTVCRCGVVKVVLKVDQVTVEREEQCGGHITFILQRDKLLAVLKHYVRRQA